MATSPEIGQFGGELFLARMGVLQTEQCADDFLHPVGFVAQDVAILLKLRLGLRRLLSISRIESVLEVVTGMVIVDELNARG
jgi:hypothetical protein